MLAISVHVYTERMKTRALLIHLPEDVYEKLRTQAFQERRSMASLLRDAYISRTSSIPVERKEPVYPAKPTVVPGVVLHPALVEEKPKRKHLPGTIGEYVDAHKE